MLSEESRKRADMLRDAGYPHNDGEMLHHMNVPFWWAGLVGGKRKILKKETLCYVDTGKAQLGVTADHVSETFLREKEQRSRTSRRT